MDIRLIQYDSGEYKKMIALRTELLRKPLGLSFTPAQLAAEKNDWLIGAFDNKEITGCCVLTHNSEGVLQLRQMAVLSSRQATGIGRKIIGFAEKLAFEKGYHTLMMHARDIATGFYRKCGYEIKGNAFIEVSILHYHMEKKLTGKFQ